PALPDVDLLRARFVTHRFSRHTHDGYVFAVIEAGVEEFEHGDGVERAGAGSVVVVNPGVVHGGHAGAPEGWAYRVLYPPVDVVAGVAADLAVRPGVPVFPEPVLDDPAAARVLRAVHRAGEKGDALAASTLLTDALAWMLAGRALPCWCPPWPGCPPARTWSGGAGRSRACRRRCVTRGRSCMRASSARRRWSGWPRPSAPARSRCCAPSGTPSGCRRTPT